MAPQGPAKESKVETAKRNSRHLRGTIAETLAADTTHFEEDDVQVLKFHGTYQQDDRDRRRQLRAQGLEKAYQFMVRCAIPGGIVGAQAYLAMDDLARRYANGTLRVTMRQDFQLHGVLKRDLKQAIASINKSLITTLAACGDGNRNVIACPAPPLDQTRALLQGLAGQIARSLRPASRAYHEIWMDEEKLASTEPEEPFYGECYLPRKYKVCLATESDNCTDILAHDCGLLAILEQGAVRGFELLVGGGLGLTHGKGDTFARLAEPLGFVDVDQAIDAVRIVTAIFRDHGNRTDRRHARLKYLIADWGMERFRNEFRRRATWQLAPPSDMPPPACHDHLGRHPQGNGRWCCGIFIENGRIADHPDKRIMSALRSIISRHRPGVTLTPQQNILLTDLGEPDLDQIEQTLSDHGVALATDLPAARRYSMACPALPTCGLALAEAERLMPSVVDRFEAELDKLGLRDVPIALRMTGCPNGCSRPYTADIAFVGRRPDVFQVYVGGGLSGSRLADLFAADVPTDELVDVLRPLLTAWAKNRRNAEGLGDHYQRLIKRSGPRLILSGKEEPTAPLLQLEVPP